MIEEAKQLIAVKGNVEQAALFADEKAESYYSKGELMKAFRWLDIKELIAQIAAESADAASQKDTAIESHTDQHPRATEEMMAA